MSFTGDVEVDFGGQSSQIDLDAGIMPVVVLDDGNDVGVPPDWPYAYSGWDIKVIHIFIF